MATIVSKNDFIGELLVAGLENPQSAVCQELCAAILKYEKDYLIKTLGYSFYKTVFATVGDGSNVDQKYVDLIDGVDYEYGGRLYQWEGLRRPAAAYIYYWYQRNHFTHTAPTGEAKAQVENAVIVSAAEKMVRAYNEAAWGAYHTDWHYDNYGGQQRCYQYLVAHVAQFTEFDTGAIKRLAPINVFNV